MRQKAAKQILEFYAPSPKISASREFRCSQHTHRLYIGRRIRKKKHSHLPPFICAHDGSNASSVPSASRVRCVEVAQVVVLGGSGTNRNCCSASITTCARVRQYRGVSANLSLQSVSPRSKNSAAIARAGCGSCPARANTSRVLPTLPSGTFDRDMLGLV